MLADTCSPARLDSVVLVDISIAEPSEPHACPAGPN